MIKSNINRIVICSVLSLAVLFLPSLSFASDLVSIDSVTVLEGETALVSVTVPEDLSIQIARIKTVELTAKETIDFEGFDSETMPIRVDSVSKSQIVIHVTTYNNDNADKVRDFQLHAVFQDLKTKKEVTLISMIRIIDDND